MKIKYELICTFIFFFTVSCFCQDSVWIKIDEGLYYSEFQPVTKSEVGDSRITIVRIDPGGYSLNLFTASELKQTSLTVKEWVEKYNLICAVNAGMFQTDYISNVGYMKNYKHVNNPRISKKYFSIAAFNPVDDESPLFRLFDTDESDLNQIIQSYYTVIQNLRLIKRPGINRWSRQKRKWSEAALGQDKDGNILLIFSRSPFSMYEFNENLISLPINIECAQHLEGGPEASLYLNYKGFELNLVGSYETDFNENKSNTKYWPVPNVIGIKKK